jgi:hypothetical protein
MPHVNPHPVQRPVAFAAQDIADANSLIETFGRLAAANMPEAPDDERRLARLLALAKGANQLLASGRAEHGVRIDELARAANYASDKHIREGFVGSWPRRWSALAIRLMMADTAPVLAEHLIARAAKVRRESNFIGYDQHPDCGKIKPLLNLYVGGIDRHLLNWQIPLTTATSYDRTHPRAALARIADVEQQLGEPLPATLVEHLELALAERATCHQLVQAGVSSRGEMFHEAGLDPATAVARAFSPLLVLDPLPHGAPRVPGEAYGRLVMPGDEAELLRVADKYGLVGIAACSDAEHASELALPSRPLDLAVATITDWGLEASPWTIAFQAIGDNLLLRVASDKGGTRATLWRVFGMSNDDQRALALAQRDSEEWTHACALRANAAAPPGLVYAKDPAFRMAVRALVRVADAARVTAERDRRARPIHT